MATYKELSINERINYKVYAALENADFIKTSMHNFKKAVPVLHQAFFPFKYGYNIKPSERKEYMNRFDLHALKFVQSL